MMPSTGFPEPELIYEGPSPNPLANPHKSEVTHETIRYEMPAGWMLPREPHLPFKPKNYKIRARMAWITSTEKTTEEGRDTL